MGKLSKQNAIQNAAKFHSKDPLYVNSHEQTIAMVAFAAGVDFWEKKMSPLESLGDAAGKLERLLNDYLRSKTDKNLREVNRQRQLVGQLVTAAIRADILTDKTLTNPNQPNLFNEKA